MPASPSHTLKRFAEAPGRVGDLVRELDQGLEKRLHRPAP